MKFIGKIIVGIIILLSTTTVCFSADADITTGCTEITFSELEEKTKDIGPDKGIKYLTEAFCTAMSGQRCIDVSANSISPDYFDANQSVFLTILCNTINHPGYTKTGYLKKADIFKFISVLGHESYCTGNMNKCDYAYYLPKIFNQIMNDMFNITQAKFFGVSSLDIKAEIAANAFSTGNIPGLQLGLCEEGNVYYKSTCKNLKSYAESARNMLKKTDIINVAGLQEEGNDASCLSRFSDNILYCGLLGSSSTYSFINTVYNEYFWYSLFMGFYTLQLDSNIKKEDRYKAVRTSVIEDDTPSVTYIPASILDYSKDIENTMIKVEQQLYKSKQAITKSLQSLAEIKSSFPLHIGLLMYQEDVKLFMNEIYKIYSPIRTLYDKFRNVQIKES